MTEQDPISSLRGGRYPLYMYASISFKRVSALTNASAVTVKPGGGVLSFFSCLLSFLLCISLYGKKEEEETKKKKEAWKCCVSFYLRNRNHERRLQIELKLGIKFGSINYRFDNLLFKACRIIGE